MNLQSQKDFLKAERRLPFALTPIAGLLFNRVNCRKFFHVAHFSY